MFLHVVALFEFLLADGLMAAMGAEFGRFFERHPQQGEGFPEGGDALKVQFRGVFTHFGEALLVGREGLPIAEEAAPFALQSQLHLLFADEGIPEHVVVDDRGGIGPGGQHRLQRPLDGPL